MALFQPVLSEPGPALESLVIRVFRQVIPAKMIVRFGASVATLFCAIARFLGFTSRLPGVARLARSQLCGSRSRFHHSVWTFANST